MKTTIQKNSKDYLTDLSQPLDISIPLRIGAENVSAWYVDPVKIEPVRTDQFTGAVAEGGSVNFRDIAFNPHGNGTHTECVGHITKKIHSINECLKQFFYLAELITVQPEEKTNGDRVISKELIQLHRKHLDAEAIIIRTLPNSEAKKTKNYSNSNPPFITVGAMKIIIESGIKHFLIDLPSVDKEVDGGELAAHHAFWEHPKNTNFERTITELVYVPNSIPDGFYLLNLQIASFENDASPSKPVLYAIA
ncbi:MAG: cyclase family protein [Vicingaceae bacterium]